MPLYMDVHHLTPGVSFKDVMNAHERDLDVQGKYDVNYKAFWVDEQQGKVFCLVEAPSPDAAHQVHAEAHGLVADEIYEVQEGT